MRLPAQGASELDPRDHPIAGRAKEIQEIERTVEAVAAGGTRGLALIGQPGIGKTALLRVACDRAQVAGLSLLTGQATEFETRVPYGIFVEALDGPLGDRDDQDLLEGLGQECVEELALVLPSLARLAGGHLDRLEVERFRLHDAVRAALEWMAAERPLLLALDDVHWADQSSLELLGYLLRHGIDAPVLLTYACRPSHAAHAAAAAREEWITGIELHPLSEEDAEALCGDDLDPSVRAELYRESGGNPFYLLELVRAHGADRRGPQGPGAGNSPPFRVRAAIGQELATLTATARALLKTASVVGEPFDFTLAARVAGLDDDAALEALDELHRVALIRTSGVPDRYSFRHPIVRRAVYRAAGDTFTRAAHARAAEALEESGASLLVRAHHIEHAARKGDLGDVEQLTTAARMTAARAPATAARWLTSALKQLPPDTPPQRRLELLISLSTALGTCGRVEESRAALAEALTLLPPGAGVAKGRLVGAMARLEHMTASHGRAREMLEEAIADVDPDPSLEAAALKLALAMDRWMAEDDAEALLASARSARREAEAVGDRPAAATAVGLESVACGYLGDLEAARVAGDEAAAMVDGMSDDELATRIEALVVLSHAQSGSVERLSDSARCAARGLAIARATGQNAWYSLLTLHLCAVNVLLGRLGDAGEAATAALEADLLVHGRPQTWALGWRCRIAVLEGDLPAAIRHGEAAIASRPTTGATLCDWLAYGSLAVARLQSGDPRGARDLVLEHLGGEGLPLVPLYWRGTGFRVLTLAELAMDDRHAAGNWAARAAEVARAYPTRGMIAEAKCAAAAVELAAGRAAEAATLALSASEDYAAAERMLDAARARALAGQAFLRDSDIPAATGLLQQAHAELDALGAHGQRDETMDVLRSLGVPAPRPARRAIQHDADPALLTAREREIAELVADGLTNREIAERLFVSPKTVEAHLTRVFTKARVPSRAALAATVERWRRGTDRSAQIDG